MILSKLSADDFIHCSRDPIITQVETEFDVRLRDPFLEGLGKP